MDYFELGGPFRREDGTWRAWYQSTPVKQYRTWESIVNRVRQRLDYSHVVLDPRWEDYQNFANWYFPRIRSGWEIDKDILSRVLGFESVTYGPDTCIMVPHSVNQYAAKWKKLSGVGQYGNQHWKVEITRERFKSEIEAHNAYRRHKLEVGLNLAAVYPNIPGLAAYAELRFGGPRVPGEALLS